MSNWPAILALLLAGLGWGTTGLFVRVLGQAGLSIYELLLIRLIVTGAIIVPVMFAFRQGSALRSKTVYFFGFTMVCYYLGAITAFRFLPLIMAALIIGSSPVIAWMTSKDRTGTSGIVLATTGLLLMVLDRHGNLDHNSHSMLESSLGYLGAIVSASITVLNARFLKRLGSLAPRPFEITVATVIIGLLIVPFLISDLRETAVRLQGMILEEPRMYVGLILGFGTIATAIPGIAIAKASVGLPPQATATVSIQLQIWSGVLAWIFLGERMTGLQIAAGVLVIVGSWLCLNPKTQVRP